MLMFGAHEADNVVASVLFQESFACHSGVVPLLTIGTSRFPLILGNRSLPIICQITVKLPLIAFINLMCLYRVLYINFTRLSSSSWSSLVIASASA